MLTGEIPTDWKRGNITPTFKKGKRKTWGMWVKNGLDGHTQGCGQCFYMWMETDGSCILQESVLAAGPCNGFDGDVGDSR